jgi:hypothetical protein
MKQMISYCRNDMEIWWISKIEMKQMITYGGNDTEIWWISKLRWNKYVDMVEMAHTLEE